MQKRTKLALVILIALLLLGFGLYLLLGPYVRERKSAQPPQLPNAVQPFVPGAPVDNTGVLPGGVTTSAVAGAQTNEARVLEYQARAIVERVGSGSSADGFLGYHDALLDATANGRASFQAEQRRMQQAHPATGPVYGISTRGVAAHVTEGKMGDAQVGVTVDAIQTIDAGVPREPTSIQAKQILVRFIQQADGSYLVDSLTWSDISL